MVVAPPQKSACSGKDHGGPRQKFSSVNIGERRWQKSQRKKKALQLPSPKFLAHHHNGKNWESIIIALRGIEGSGPNLPLIMPFIFILFGFLSSVLCFLRFCP